MLGLHKYLLTLVVVVAGLSTGSAAAQTFSVGTNALELANFGTLSLQAGMGVAQHLSVVAEARCNPWQFHSGKRDILVRNQQLTAGAGLRYWPWYVNSGWWVEGKGQFQKFSRTGVWRPALEEAKAVGAALGFGYTLMLNEHLNIEFGASGWAGRYLEYNLYCCPDCMDIRDSGPRGFIAADTVYCSIIYVF